MTADDFDAIRKRQLELFRRHTEPVVRPDPQEPTAQPLPLRRRRPGENPSS